MMVEDRAGVGVERKLRPSPPPARVCSMRPFAWRELATMLLSSCRQIGDPDPSSAGTVGDAARWRGSMTVVRMAANPPVPTRPAVIGLAARSEAGAAAMAPHPLSD